MGERFPAIGKNQSNVTSDKRRILERYFYGMLIRKIWFIFICCSKNHISEVTVMGCNLAAHFFYSQPKQRVMLGFWPIP